MQVVNQDREALRKSASYKHSQYQQQQQQPHFAEMMMAGGSGGGGGGGGGNHQRTASDSSSSKGGGGGGGGVGGGTNLSRSHSIAASSVAAVAASGSGGGGGGGGGGFMFSTVRNPMVLVSGYEVALLMPACLARPLSSTCKGLGTSDFVVVTTRKIFCFPRIHLSSLTPRSPLAPSSSTS